MYSGLSAFFLQADPLITLLKKRSYDNVTIGFVLSCILTDASENSLTPEEVSIYLDAKYREADKLLLPEPGKERLNFDPQKEKAQLKKQLGAEGLSEKK